MLNLSDNKRANQIRQMAAHFDAELEEGNDSSSITMDNGRAKGFISSYRVFPGLIVWIYNIDFHSDFNALWEPTKECPYYFSYNVKGHFRHRFLDEEKFSDVLQNQNMIVKESPNAGVEVIFPAHTKLEIVLISVDMELLSTVNSRDAKRISSQLQSIFESVHDGQTFRYLGNIDTATKKYASRVCNNYKTDLVGSLRTGGAILNMLASQIQSYSHDVGEVDPEPGLRKVELARITTIGAYFLKNLDQKFTISDLSSTFGISPKKLQIGIKFLYGTSVGHYLTNLRMGEAKNLIVTTDLNCSEVSHRVGISSMSYFSKLFKQRYGISPSRLKTR